MSKVRVLHVLPDLRRGGQERLVLETCRALRGFDVESRILTFGAGNEYEELASGLDIQTITDLPRLRLGRPKLSGTGPLRKAIAEYAPTVVHTHSFLAEVLTRGLGIAGPAYITHCHEEYSQYAPLRWSTLSSWRAATDYFERLVVIGWYRRLGNCFIAVSNSIARYLKATLPYCGEIDVLHNGLDLSRFNPPLRSAPVKPRLSLVTTGSVEANKNHRFLLDVIPKLVGRGWNVHLNVLGGGTLREGLEREAASRQLTPRVHFRGVVRDVERYLAEADLYVHVAFREAFGLAILEAMAMGLPAVTLEAGGNPELVTHGVTGLVLRQGDSDGFAAAVSGVASDPARYMELSVASQLRARAFDMGQYSQRLCSYYRAAVDRAEQRGS